MRPTSWVVVVRAVIRMADSFSGALPLPRRTAIRFVVFIGVVSLFSDMTSRSWLDIATSRIRPVELKSDRELWKRLCFGGCH